MDLIRSLRRTVYTFLLCKREMRTKWESKTCQTLLQRMRDVPVPMRLLDGSTGMNPLSRRYAEVKAKVEDVLKLFRGLVILQSSVIMTTGRRTDKGV